MEKILFKKVGYTFFVFVIAITLVFSSVLYFIESHQSKEGLAHRVHQLMSSYNNTLILSEDIESSFKSDYFNRAYAIDFMLANPLNNDGSRLQYIKTMMEVAGIYVVSKDGNILFSSEEEDINKNMFQYEDSGLFIDFRDPSYQGAIISMEAICLYDKEPLIYVTVPASLYPDAMVQIAVPASILTQQKETISMKSILSNTPTDKEHTLFAVDTATGDVVGITKNNEQELNIDNVNNVEDFVQALRHCKEPKTLMINGKNRFVQTIEIDQMIFGAYVDRDSVYKTVIMEILYVTLGVGLSFLCVLKLLRKYIRRYVLEDLSKIEKQVQDLIVGHKDVNFDAKYDTELHNITKVLNSWKESENNKTKRMTQIIKSINQNAAVFECIGRIGQCLYSQNMQEILCLSHYEWQKIKDDLMAFEKFVQDLCLQKETRGFILWREHYLNISMFKENDEFYGLIVDVTEQFHKEEAMQKELKKVTLISETDALTQLTNRIGLEKIITNILNQLNPQGILMIFDLDHFKQVNDALGHPEGDKVLIQFARILKNTFCQNKESVARLGGDEFMVFLEGPLPIEELKKKLDFVIRQMDMEMQSYKRYHLSTSIGVAYINNEIKSFEELYHDVDEALYQAKRNGKNQYFIQVK